MELKIDSDKKLVIYSDEGRIIPFLNYVLWTFGIVSIFFFAVFLASSLTVPNQENIVMIKSWIQLILFLFSLAIICSLAVLVLEIRSYRKNTQDELN